MVELEFINNLKEQLAFLKQEIIHKNVIIERLMICNCCISSIIKNNDDKKVHTTINEDMYINDIVKSQKSNVEKSHDISIIKIDDKNVTKRRKKVMSGDNSLDKQSNENGGVDVIKELELRTIEIIGDSMLNNINARGLSNKGNVKVFNHPSATCEDLKDHINPSIKRKPNILICHIGTNYLSKNVATITELQTIINRVKRKSPHSKLALSSCLVRKDCPKLEKR